LKLPETEKRLSRRGIGSAGAWVVFAGIVVAGLLLTAWAYQLLSQVDRERQLATLEGAAEQAVGSILGQFARFETQITAGQALFRGSGRVTREDWRAFARTFQGDNGQGRSFFEMAWLPEVPAGELPRLRERLADDGIDAFSMDPPGRREVYCPIVYNEPWEVHADSLGHDACARDSTWPAMARAKTSGSASLSSPLGLITADGETISGYVMLAWVESSNGQFSGWVSGTISIDSVFDIVQSGAPGLELVVTDRSNPETALVVFGDADDAHGARQSATVQRRLQLGGRELQLDFYQSLSAGPAPGLLLASGTVITLLLAGFLRVLLRTRTRALQLAERMSYAWRASEEMLSSITNNVLEGIYRGVPNEGLVYVNQSLVEMFAFNSAREMLGAAGPILYASPQQRDELHRNWSSMVSTATRRSSSFARTARDSRRSTTVLPSRTSRAEFFTLTA